jgi:hypothetical protein
MKIGFYNFYRQHNRNRMFETADCGIGDDLGYPFVHLARRFRDEGWGLATIDTEPLENFDAVVFLDHPTILNPWFRRLARTRRVPIHLVIFESPAVRPDNWIRRNHAPFTKIFTWHPAWVDGRKYIRMHMPHKLPEYTPYEPSRAEKFCCLIASQKYSWAREELYTERVRAIRWFERHHPDEFDLYGQRWDRPYLSGPLSIVNPVLARLYHRFPGLPRRQQFPSARGSVTSKRAVMQRYRFCICYENASYPGWLTEKMLDAMFAGSVPVYLGDPEVTTLVPAGAFVDKRLFRDYAELYAYLKGMSAAEYEGYRKAIHDFVHGEAIRPLGADAFVDMIVREVVTPLLAKR